MAKMINAIEIPANAQAIVWENPGDSTSVTFKKSKLAAVRAYNKISGVRETGWQVISSADREHGFMVW